jgi:hypothetical protein
MFGMMRCVSLFGGVMLVAGLARAAEPEQKALPQPRAVEGEIVGPWVSYLRPNPYDVWQVYAVDNRGMFRPRVILAPDGPRYAYNGLPYPWWQNYPGNFERTIANRASMTERPAAPIVIVPIEAGERMPYVEE